MGSLSSDKVVLQADGENAIMPRTLTPSMDGGMQAIQGSW